MDKLCQRRTSLIGWISIPFSSILFRRSDTVFASLSSSICIQNHVIGFCYNPHSPRHEVSFCGLQIESNDEKIIFCNLTRGCQVKIERIITQLLKSISGITFQVGYWISHLYHSPLFGSSESFTSSNSPRYSLMDLIHSPQMMWEIYDGKTLGISSFTNPRNKSITNIIYWRKFIFYMQNILSYLIYPIE